MPQRGSDGDAAYSTLQATTHVEGGWMNLSTVQRVPPFYRVFASGGLFTRRASVLTLSLARQQGIALTKK